MFKKIFIIFILETETAETYSCTMTVRFFSVKIKERFDVYLFDL